MFSLAHRVRHTYGTMRSNGVDGGHGQTLPCAEAVELHATDGHSGLHEDPVGLLQQEQTCSTLHIHVLIIQNRE